MKPGIGHNQPPPAQGALDLVGGRYHGVTWHRDPGPLYPTCGAIHHMLVGGEPNGAIVAHCGHPTALRPYYVSLPNGAVIERKFRLLADAKAAAIEACK
jgi:hypothetical protein